VLRAAVYPEAVALTSLALSPYWTFDEMPHVGWQAAPAALTDRVLPAVGVSGLWGKCPPKSPEQRPICVT